MSDRDTGGRALALSRRVLFGEQPDPRVLQAVFTVIFALDLGLRQLAGPAGGMGRWPIASVPVIVVAGVLAVTVPWSRVSSTALAVVPLLDLAALGMSRMNPDSSGAGILVVVPALWLGRTLGRRGALVVLLGSSLLTALPPIIYLHGGGGPVLGRSILVPVVATWAALAVAVNRERARDGIAEADLRREQLDAARGTIEHQRRVAAAILDTVDVGLVLLDAAGAYESMNKRHADFIRLAFPDGHQGRAGQVGLVFHEDGTTPVRAEEMPSYRASRGEEFDDCRIWCGDDPVTRRALSVSARSVRDGDGRFTGAALAYKDVTDFMRALRVKDDFVASVSHELRTPLTSIMGYVNILLETDEVHGEPRRQLEVVARNSDRLRRLVSDLLHTARFDVEPLTVVRQPSDLSRIVRDALEAATPVATSSRVTIHHELP
ncbi:MAG: histidine kinase dimerization/phospho-acceptor domain-containing protein, partial [Nocardioides sp.]